jgi:stromal membrane-associated protein
MVESLISQALTLEENRNCADCNTSPVTHVSVQNGVTLCQKCATLHSEQLLRQKVSWTRPIEISTWRPDHLTALVNGGNKGFNQFMAPY